MRQQQAVVRSRSSFSSSAKERDCSSINASSFDDSEVMRFFQASIFQIEINPAPLGAVGILVCTSTSHPTFNTWAVGTAEPSRDSPDGRCKEQHEQIAGVLVFHRSSGDSSSTSAANTATTQSYPTTQVLNLYAIAFCFAHHVIMEQRLVAVHVGIKSVYF